MKFRFLFLYTFFAVLSASAFAQGSVNPSHLSLRSGNSFSRLPVTSDTAITPAAVRALEKDTFQLINSERAMAGLAPLKWSEKIADVARLHSNNMADYNFFSHKGLDGLMVDERAAQLNMGEWRAIGENIAFMKGFQDPVGTAVAKWLQSTGHKKNLLNPTWTETAIGLAVTPDGKYYFTQVFVRN